MKVKNTEPHQKRNNKKKGKEKSKIKKKRKEMEASLGCGRSIRRQRPLKKNKKNRRRAIIRPRNLGGKKKATQNQQKLGKTR